MTHTPVSSYPDEPGFKENTTSKDAAESMRESAPRLRRAVLNFLEDWFPSGFTADEIASRLNLSILSIRPRVSELSTVGAIEKTGERRKNESGQTAHVWRVSKTPTPGPL